MVDFYTKHTIRKRSLLDGVWSFKTDPADVGLHENWARNFPADGMDAAVPACWNNELGLYDYEGVAWYKTDFACAEGSIRLTFHAVTGQADVFVDGIHAAGHYGGFTGFDVTLDGIEGGAHTLVVRVDNTHNADTIPLPRVDWFHYGGIYRSVELFELAPARVDAVYVDYTLDTERKSAGVCIRTFLSAKTGFEADLNVRVLFEGQLLAEQKAEMDTTNTLNCGTLESLKLWDIHTPSLYQFTVQLIDAQGKVLDDCTERVGFRTVQAGKNKLLLNGRQIYLKGVNRHEEHPDWGFAVPFKLIKKDLDIIRNMGCNAIRCSHYPNSREFLDYCDQNGMLVWEEIPMWGFPKEALANPRILERGLQMHEELVQRDYNHPSILLWGLHNEIDTRSPEGYAITKAFAQKVRSMDSSRLITYATMHPMEDTALEFADIVSVNKYYGWYEGDLSGWDTFLVRFKERLAALGMDEKPVILSEFGAGALYGDSTFEAPKWTENYQSRCIDYTLRLFHQTEGVVGSYIWQYCDIRTAKELEMGRPRSFNNKGLVNEYRKPKQAYWTAREIYSSFDEE